MTHHPDSQPGPPQALTASTVRSVIDSTADRCSPLDTLGEPPPPMVDAVDAGQKTPGSNANFN